MGKVVVKYSIIGSNFIFFYDAIIIPFELNKEHNTVTKICMST